MILTHILSESGVGVLYLIDKASVANSAISGGANAVIIAINWSSTAENYN